MSGSSSSDECVSNIDCDSDSSLPSLDPIPVPRCSFQPFHHLIQLLTAVDPMMLRWEQGKGLYIEATNVLGQHLTAGCQVWAVCNKS